MPAAGLTINAKTSTRWLLTPPRARQILDPAEERWHKRAGLRVKNRMQAQFKRVGRARKAPKRKFKADGRTYTKPFRRYLEEVKRRPSAPAGSPPYTHTGRIRRAVAFAFSAWRRVTYVGPRKSIIGQAAAVHESGGQLFGRRYPARPFRARALEKSRDYLVKLWQDSLKPK